MSSSNEMGANAKRARIISAARDAFIELGYDAISMDEIARRAGVVKQTVYSYFSGKDALFLAALEHERTVIDGLMEFPLIDSPAQSRVALCKLGLQLLEKIVVGSSLIPSLRVAISASHRFADLGKADYDGIRQRQIRFAEIFRKAAQAGVLRIDSPETAADHFITLIRGEIFLHCLLDGNFRPTRAAMVRQVESAVDCFLAKYVVVDQAGTSINRSTGGS